MRKIKCVVEYPWAGTVDDIQIIEIDDDCTEEEIAENANETLEDMMYNRISAYWEEID